MKDFPAAFQRQTESYEFSLRFCSLQDAEQAARDLIDFLMAGVRPKKGQESEPTKETVPEPQEKPVENSRTIPRGPIADDLNRYMNEHAYSERDMAKILGVAQTTINHWRSGICLPTGDKMKDVFYLLYGYVEGDGTK